MILARCPACGTTFRVHPEQLQARGGRVRCGQCKHAFNALDSRIGEESATTTDQPSAPSESPAAAGDAPDRTLFVLEEKAPAPLAASSNAAGWHDEPPASEAAEGLSAGHPEDSADRLDAIPDTTNFVAGEWPEVEIDTFADADLRPEPADSPDDAAIVFDPQPGWPSATDLDLTPPAPEPIPKTHLDFDALLRKQDPGDPTAALTRVIDTEAGSAGTGLSPSPFHAPPAPRPAEAAEAGLAEPDEDRDGIASRQEAASLALRQAVWAAAATFLGLALLAQGILIFRSDIAQSSPPLRPFMESLCAGLGCDLPLPRDAAEIAIESSDIQPDASREAFFMLHATLRNRADFPQAYPHLEVTLTDARDRALVRRVLTPPEWLPAGTPREAFPAKREVAARVGFEAPGVAAAGYRVYAFYP